MKKHRVFFRCLASCCRLDKGTPLSASCCCGRAFVEARKLLLRPSLVFSLSSSGKRSMPRGSMDVRVKPEHDSNKRESLPYGCLEHTLSVFPEFVL